MKLTDEEFEMTAKNLLKSVIYKSGELLVLIIFFFITSSNTDMTTDYAIFSILLIIVVVVSLTIIRKLWIKVKLLEEIVEYEAKSTFDRINKLVVYVDKVERLNNMYFSDYGIVEYDIKSNTVTFISDTFQRMFNVVHNPVAMDLSWLKDQVAFVDFENAVKVFDRWVSGTFYVEHYEYWFKVIKGNNIYCKIFAIPKYNINEELIGFKIYYRDVTEDLLKEEALEGQKAFVSQIIVDGVKRKVLRDSVIRHLQKLKGDCNE